MELKYYLRGLGLGIMITAIVLSITTSKQRSMTDAEIIARAKELGMIEDTVMLTETSDENTTEGTDSSIDENTEAVIWDNEVNTDPIVQVTDEEDGLAETEGDIQESDSDLTENAEDAEPDVEDLSEENEAVEDEPSENEMIENTESNVGNKTEGSLVITIGGGEGSYTVSRKLAEIGAVASAEAFDTFLCENGYDKRIRSGAHTIPANASNEQIARIITGAE